MFFLIEAKNRAIKCSELKSMKLSLGSCSLEQFFLFENISFHDRKSFFFTFSNTNNNISIAQKKVRNCIFGIGAERMCQCVLLLTLSNLFSCCNFIILLIAAAKNNKITIMDDIRRTFYMTADC